MLARYRIGLVFAIETVRLQISPTRLRFPYASQVVAEDGGVETLNVDLQFEKYGFRSGDCCCRGDVELPSLKSNRIINSIMFAQLQKLKV